MSSIEQAITEAVTTDSPQVLLSAGGFPDAFDAAWSAYYNSNCN